MRRAADEPPAAEIAATLEVVEGTLTGEPVDPDRAEVAELVLLLAGERPDPSDEFASELDRRVQDRFGEASKAAAKTARRRARRGWWWVLAPVGGLAALAVVIAFIASASGGLQTTASSRGGLSAPARVHTPSPLPVFPSATSGHAVRSKPNARASATAPIPGLRTPGNGRKLIQSSQLTLEARPRRIEAVAQEALKVVGSHNGFVDSATVNAAGGSSGYANLQLTVPSATLPQTMTLLSRLPYSAVLSRVDKVEDVTAQLRSAERHHQKARIHALEQGVAYSKVSLYIRADTTPSSASHHAHGGGFTIGRAAHDALGILTVIGGIMVITLAVLVPLAAVLALAWQISVVIGRRRREHALDLA